ncbi:hypothetical protein [Kamptonema formosum]|uniref:hypothetical protein n=1 Tax=Kamptonema formosum TaxID=331992 RepID=UPI0012DC3135|nr:hypothetical protein [Oscillatoria sp. PCC 10802]
MVKLRYTGSGWVTFRASPVCRWAKLDANRLAFTSSEIGHGALGQWAVGHQESRCLKRSGVWQRQ